MERARLHNGSAAKSYFHVRVLCECSIIGGSPPSGSIGGSPPSGIGGAPPSGSIRGLASIW